MSIDSLKIVTTLCEAIEENNNQGAWRSHQRITSWWRMQHEINSLANPRQRNNKTARPIAHNVNIAHKVDRPEAYANRTTNQIDMIEYSILSSEQHKSP